MRPPPDKPKRNAEPENAEGHAFAERMLSEPMILACALGIFVFCAVVLEWSTLLDLALGLFGVEP